MEKIGVSENVDMVSQSDKRCMLVAQKKYLKIR